MQAWVIDTNVLLVAGRHHKDISADCIKACVLRLQDIQKEGQVVLDDGYLILSEYNNKTNANQGKSVADVFLKWLLRHEKQWLKIPLQEHLQRGFVSFPEDVDLEDFDPADRKFVAVAARCAANPPILQAADSKWLGWATALRRHGVEVEFICRKDLQRFRKRKGAA